MNKCLNGRKFQFQNSKRYEKTEAALSLHGGGRLLLDDDDSVVMIGGARKKTRYPMAIERFFINFAPKFKSTL